MSTGKTVSVRSVTGAAMKLAAASGLTPSRVDSWSREAESLRAARSVAIVLRWPCTEPSDQLDDESACSAWPSVASSCATAASACRTSPSSAATAPDSVPVACDRPSSPYDSCGSTSVDSDCCDWVRPCASSCTTPVTACEASTALPAVSVTVALARLSASMVSCCWAFCCSSCSMMPASSGWSGSRSLSASSMVSLSFASFSASASRPSTRSWSAVTSPAVWPMAAFVCTAALLTSELACPTDDAADEKYPFAASRASVRRPPPSSSAADRVGSWLSRSDSVARARAAESRDAATVPPMPSSRPRASPSADAASLTPLVKLPSAAATPSSASCPTCCAPLTTALLTVWMNIELICSSMAAAPASVTFGATEFFFSFT